MLKNNIIKNFCFVFLLGIFFIPLSAGTAFAALTIGNANIASDGTLTITGTGITFGNSSAASITLATDGTGNGEVVFPAGSISSEEIFDGTISNDDISSSAAILFSKLSGVAALGANSDITSLSGITTALSVTQGGTGTTTISGILKGNGSNAFLSVAAPSGVLVGTTDTQTLTNKTISILLNTLTGVAASGANTDITSLAGLTSPLSVAQGGTATTTLTGIRLSISAASAGANSDITSLSGLSTALSLLQGGTGTTTAVGIRNVASAAASGANIDITSLSGLTTPLSITQGGTGLAFAGSSGNILRSDGTNFVSTAITTAQSTPSDPSTTTNTTGVMMGLAGSITPVRSGIVLILISGDIDSDTIGDGAQVQIRYGTGSAPANGAALTGTTLGGLVKVVNPSIALLTVGRAPFSLNAIVTGLTPSTAYWIDLSLAAITGGTARIRDVSISVIEL